jgi:flagellin
MPITIASNIASLGAQRQLGKASESLVSTFERLSSGMRINKASDDAAGLAISMSLKTDARVFSQGIRNLSDGVSLLNIADGALEQLSSITQRQLELAEQSANGTYSTQQRVALNTEINSLSKEYNRILESTTFNGISIFSDEQRTRGLALQAGYGTDGVLGLLIGANGSRSVGDGTYSSFFTAASGHGWVTMLEAADFNGDGIADLIASNDGSGAIRLSLGNSDGTFAAGTVIADTSENNFFMKVGDFNGDGKKDFFVTTQLGKVVSYIGDGQGSFSAGMTFTDATYIGDGFDVADINGDGRDDIIQSGNGAGRIYLSNANGTFTVGNTFGIEFSSGSSNVRVVKDTLSNSYNAIFLQGGVGTSIKKLGADGSVQSTTQTLNAAASGAQTGVGDFDGDGIGDFVQLNSAGTAFQVFLGNGNGTFRSGQSFTGTAILGYISTGVRIGDLNGDGILDLVQSSASGNISYLGTGTGTFAAGVASTASGNNSTLALADVNRDGILDVISNDGTFGNGNLKVTVGDATKTLTTKRFDITTQANSREALTFLNAQLERVSLERGSIGAFMSRIGTAISTTTSARDNYTSANSKIVDTDMAQETANLTRSNILQQVGASVLAQANVQPSLALRLLQG